MLYTSIQCQSSIDTKVPFAKDLPSEMFSAQPASTYFELISPIFNISDITYCQENNTRLRRVFQ